MSTRKPLCISIGPFGDNELQQSYRRDLELVLAAAFQPDYEYKPFWVLPKIDMPTDIFSALVDSDLVVADLRGLNPNVMYELGIRHAFNKPVLHMIDQTTDAPWDVDKNYMVRYSVPVQVSHQNDLVDVLRTRARAIMDLAKDPIASLNTFQSHCRVAAKIDNFRGDTSTKDLLALLLKRVESTQLQLDALRNEQRQTSHEIRQASLTQSAAASIVSGWAGTGPSSAKDLASRNGYVTLSEENWPTFRG